jgi:hypothetical protein
MGTGYAGYEDNNSQGRYVVKPSSRLLPLSVASRQNNPIDPGWASGEHDLLHRAFVQAAAGNVDNLKTPPPCFRSADAPLLCTAFEPSPLDPSL